MKKYDTKRKSQFILNIPLELMRELFEKAKQMEKEQIIEAAERWKGTKFAEQYYNETYGSKGSGVLKEEGGAVSSGSGAVASSQTEISDEEIEKQANEYANVYQCPSEIKMCKHDIISAWNNAIKWYREQLKQRQ